MDLLLLFNLLLGSLLVFPYLSKGEAVVLEMPDYPDIGTELKIKCSYSNFKELSALSLMENGNQRVRVEYQDEESTVQDKAVYTIITPNSGIKLETEGGSSQTTGAFTFVMTNIECKDFTSYTCVANSGIKSNEKTLKVRPGIESITPNMMDLSVHQVYTFTCNGTVSKEGPFSVQWYRRTISQANRLIPTQQAQIIGQSNCSRSVESQLSYNVIESDVPNLILWCKIDGGQSVEDKKNYTVQGQNLDISMPDYEAIGTDLRIKCSYSNFKQLLVLSLMADGNEIVKVSYDIDESMKEGKTVYTKSSNSRIKLEIEEGTTLKDGAFTFVMQKVECKDFKSYTCETGNGMKSIAKQLQVRPGIESITPNMMELSVHQIYTFTCRGTVSKDGPFDVQWYRRTITQANRLIPTQQAQIIGQNDCSRSVQSQLSYNVTESDVPNLILWCKIDGGQSVEAKKNYTVQEPPKIVFISSNAMELSVYQVYTFTCRGTVSKDGPFDVQWYRSTIWQPKRLIPTQQAQIISQDDRSRSVESQLFYNVTIDDVPNFTMWCRIESGRSVENKRSFNVQVLMLINSATTYESKTLAMAFSCIFFFLVLFTLFD